MNRFRFALFTFTVLNGLILSAESGASELTLWANYGQNSPTLVHSTSNAAFSAGYGYGGGVLFSTFLSRRIAFELGAGYSMRAWSDSFSGDLKVPTLQLPAGFQLWLGRFFALDAGGYYASMNSSRGSYIAASDYGVYGGAWIRFPLGHRFGLMLGGRYSHGLANVSLVGGTLQFRSVDALAGLQIRLSYR